MPQELGQNSFRFAGKTLLKYLDQVDHISFVTFFAFDPHDIAALGLFLFHQL